MRCALSSLTEVVLSYHRVCGLYFRAVLFVATIYYELTKTAILPLKAFTFVLLLALFVSFCFNSLYYYLHDKRTSIQRKVKVSSTGEHLLQLNRDSLKFFSARYLT